MSELGDRLEQELEKLKTRRDELRVQLDLGKKDLQDSWEEAEHRWHKLEGYLGRIKHEGQEALDEVGDAAELLLDEIKDGFKRLRSLV